MRGIRNRYGLLGLSLVIGGSTFSLVTWLVVEYMPLVALGISGVTLGAVSLALGRSLPQVPPEASLVLLEAGFDNIAALVEELGLRSRALYLPQSLTEGPARALIPLHRNSSAPDIPRPVERRLIVRFGPGSQDFGILVATPGSAALGLRDVPLGSSSGELEVALSALLVGMLDLVETVRVRRDDTAISVEVARPALPWRNHPAYDILGSPVASIVAAVTAQAVEQPVSVVSETRRGAWLAIELEVVAIQ